MAAAEAYTTTNRLERVRKAVLVLWESISSYSKNHTVTSTNYN
jgi:hypothetical protein